VITRSASRLRRLESRRTLFAIATLFIAAVASGRPSRCDAPRGADATSASHILAPTSAVDPAPPPPGAISIAMLPDIQYYTECESPHLTAQLRWLAAPTPPRDMRAALFMGDLTEHNSPHEWDYLRGQFALAADRVPLLLATGNHDQGHEGDAHSRSSRLAEYFPRAPGAAQAILKDQLNEHSIENAYYRIALPHVVLGVLVLEWAPRKSTVAWANEILRRHERDRVIIVTHAYLYDDSTRYDWRTRRTGQLWNPLSFDMAWGEAILDPESDGEILWNDLVRRHAGVFLVLCGHVGGRGTGLLASRGDAGNLVQQVLANFQLLDEGGLGYLRLFEIQPDGKSMRMKTYSPSLGLFATAPTQQADLPIEPALW
jgi:hypothetical protein